MTTNEKEEEAEETMQQAQQEGNDGSFERHLQPSSQQQQQRQQQQVGMFTWEQFPSTSFFRHCRSGNTRAVTALLEEYSSGRLLVEYNNDVGGDGTSGADRPLAPTPALQGPMEAGRAEELGRAIKASPLGKEKMTMVILSKEALLQRLCSVHQSPLSEAALSGNVQLCRLLLETAPDLAHHVNQSGETPMFNAALKGHLAVMQLFHDSYSMSLKKSNAASSSAVFYAAAKGHVDVVKWVCKVWPGAVRQVNLDRECIASVAARKGRLAVIQWWHAAGHPLQHFTTFKRTPITVAARHGQVDVVRWFLDHNIAPEPKNAKHSDGKFSALAGAAGGGHHKIVDLLLRRHPFQPTSIAHGIKAACQARFPQIAFQITDFAVKASLFADSVNVAHICIRTATRHAHVPLLQKLVETYGSQLCAGSQGYCSLLVPAIASQSMETLKWVVEAEIDRLDNAVGTRRLMRRFSLTRSTPSSSGRYHGPSASQIAAALKAPGAFRPVVLEAIESKCLAMLRWLMAAFDLPVDVLVFGSSSALHEAARLDRPRLLLYFLRDLRMTPHLQDHQKNCPLHLAAKFGHTTCVKVLLTFGSDPALRNSANRTPLGLAMIHDQKHAVALLKLVKKHHLSPAHVALLSGLPSLLAAELRAGYVDPDPALALRTDALDTPPFVAVAALNEPQPQMMSPTKRVATGSLQGRTAEPAPSLSAALLGAHTEAGEEDFLEDGKDVLAQVDAEAAVAHPYQLQEGVQAHQLAFELSLGWRPQTNRWFSASFRKRVFVFFASVSRVCPETPDVVIFSVLERLVRADVDRSSLQSRDKRDLAITTRQDALADEHNRQRAQRREQRRSRTASLFSTFRSTNQ